MNRFLQWILLLLSIIGLVYLVMVYLGLFRYYTIHQRSTEPFIQSYPSLPEVGSKDRVILCFSATTDQIDRLTPFINSILDQTVRIHDIVLIIPEKDKEKIPNSLKPILSVYGYKKEYENADTLICSVLREPEENTKIIIVDPEMVYGSDFIETLVEESNQYPDKIISVDPTPTKRGMLIKPKFFDDKISDYQTGKGVCQWLRECCNQRTSKQVRYPCIYRRMNR